LPEADSKPAIDLALLLENMMPIRFARKSLSKSSRADGNLRNHAWSSASNTRRLRIESLELRQLMTADLSFDINQYASDRLLVQLRSEATLSNIIENVQGIVQANPIGESGWHQL
jgi:hypothetical protein